MRCGGSKIGIAQAAKHAKRLKIGGTTVKKLVGSGNDVGFAWAAIEKVCGGGESLSPPWVWHGCMYKESADTIIECTKDTFGLAILLGGVWAGEAKKSSMGGKKIAVCSVLEFSSIFGLKTFNRG